MRVITIKMSAQNKTTNNFSIPWRLPAIVAESYLSCIARAQNTTLVWLPRTEVAGKRAVSFDRRHSARESETRFTEREKEQRWF